MVNCHKCHESLENVKLRLDTLSKKIDQIQRNDPEQVFFDTQQFMYIMNISKRTAQTWRQEGLISFSKVGNKFYYRLSDILLILDKYFIKSKE